MFFPDQLPQLLELAGLKEVPPNHPFKGKETLVPLGFRQGRWMGWEGGLGEDG